MKAEPSQLILESLQKT